MTDKPPLGDHTTHSTPASIAPPLGDHTTYSTTAWIAMLHTVDGLKGARQLLYQAMKHEPRLREDYERAEQAYRDLALKFGIPVKPVFDEDEFRKSQRYQDIMSGKIA